MYDYTAYLRKNQMSNKLSDIAILQLKFCHDFKAQSPYVLVKIGPLGIFTNSTLEKISKLKAHP